MKVKQTRQNVACKAAGFELRRGTHFGDELRDSSLADKLQKYVQNLVYHLQRELTCTVVVVVTFA